MKKQEKETKIKPLIEGAMMKNFLFIFLIFAIINISKMFVKYSLGFGMFLFNWLNVIVLICGVCWLVYTFFFTRSLNYILKEKTLIKEGGIFRLFSKNVPLSKITDVSLERGIADRLVGVSVIHIQTAGSPDIEVSLDNLSEKVAVVLKNKLSDMLE